MFSKFVQIPMYACKEDEGGSKRFLLEKDGHVGLVYYWARRKLSELDECFVSRFVSYDELIL